MIGRSRALSPKKQGVSDELFGHRKIGSPRPRHGYDLATAGERDFLEFYQFKVSVNTRAIIPSVVAGRFKSILSNGCVLWESWWDLALIDFYAFLSMTDWIQDWNPSIYTDFTGDLSVPESVTNQL